MPLTASHQSYITRVETVYVRNGELLEELHSLVVPHASGIADKFYSDMMESEEARSFLSHSLVNTRLRHTMADWIGDLLSPRSKDGIAAHIERQHVVGVVHARINIPMGLVNHGLSIIKQELGDILLNADLPAKKLGTAFMVVNEVLDQAISLINESYLGDMVTNQRHEQSLRLHVLSRDVPLECERVRSGLFDWLRNTLTLLHQNNTHNEVTLNSLKHSEVGMWVQHKAELMFPGHKEVEDLHEILDKLDMEASKACKSRDESTSESFQTSLLRLNELTSDAGWLLSNLTERSLQQEDGRDPLTRVLNRRYLPIIMQRETELSIKHQAPYSALMVDLDHFKKVNDKFGHPGGDAILRQFSEVLLGSVRASDFVFRMGGEEFLVVLVNIDSGQAWHVAENLRKAVECREYQIDGEPSFKLTVSIGVATHDGHPDYAHVLDAADDALYKAKDSGRNRVFVAAE